MATKTLGRKRLTPSLTKRDVATYAVYLLGGAERPIDTEDAAKKAAELMPTAFAWRKYPDQINLELVRAVLSDSKKQRYGALLHGTGTSGWRLSAAGVTWAAQVEDQVKAGLSLDQAQIEPWAGSSDARRADREIERTKVSAAWQQWKNGQTVSARAAMDLFRIDDYADATMRDMKISRLRRLVAEDREAADLVEIAAKQTVLKE